MEPGRSARLSDRPTKGCFHQPYQWPIERIIRTLGWLRHENNIRVSALRVPQHACVKLAVPMVSVITNHISEQRRSRDVLEVSVFQYTKTHPGFFLKLEYKLVKDGGIVANRS